MIEKREPPRNNLLARLTREELGSICTDLHRTEFVPGDRFSGPNAPLEGVWFPEAGFVSVMLRDDRNIETEIAKVDRRSAIGTFDQDTRRDMAFECTVQHRGAAHFLAADTLPSVMQRVPAIKTLISSAMSSLLCQIALQSHANARGRIIERVARWLLTAQDCVEIDVVFVTHETLSTMLGVWRVGVTNALHMLEGKHLIRSYRGRVRILDRGGLIETANSLYSVTTSDKKHQPKSIAAE